METILSLLKSLVGVGLGLMLSGCTIVQVNGKADISHFFFLSKVIIQKTETAEDDVAVKTRGIGYHSDATGITVGYYDENYVLMNDLSACRVVVFTEPKSTVPKAGAAKGLSRELDPAHICNPKE